MTENDTWKAEAYHTGKIVGAVVLISAVSILGYNQLTHGNWTGDQGGEYDMFCMMSDDQGCLVEYAFREFPSNYTDRCIGSQRNKSSMCVFTDDELEYHMYYRTMENRTINEALKVKKMSSNISVNNGSYEGELVVSDFLFDVENKTREFNASEYMDQYRNSLPDGVTLRYENITKSIPVKEGGAVTAN